MAICLIILLIYLFLLFFKQWHCYKHNSQLFKFCYEQHNTLNFLDS